MLHSAMCTLGFNLDERRRSCFAALNENWIGKIRKFFSSALAPSARLPVALIKQIENVTNFNYFLIG